MESLDILAWVIGLLRADSEIRVWGLPVALGLVQDATLTPPYITVGLQSDVSNSAMCGSVSDGRDVVQVSVWHFDVAEAEPVVRRVRATLEAASRSEAGKQQLKCSRVGGVVVSEPAVLPEVKPGRVNAGSVSVQGARRLVWRCASLWAVTFQPVVVAPVGQGGGGGGGRPVTQ